MKKYLSKNLSLYDKHLTFSVNNFGFRDFLTKKVSFS